MLLGHRRSLGTCDDPKNTDGHFVVNKGYDSLPPICNQPYLDLGPRISVHSFLIYSYQAQRLYVYMQVDRSPGIYRRDYLPDGTAPKLRHNSSPRLYKGRHSKAIQELHLLFADFLHGSQISFRKKRQCGCFQPTIKCLYPLVPSSLNNVNRSQINNYLVRLEHPLKPVPNAEYGKRGVRENDRLFPDPHQTARLRF